MTISEYVLPRWMAEMKEEEEEEEKEEEEEEEEEEEYWVYCRLRAALWTRT